MDNSYMKHCIECGAPLIERYLKNEGNVPYCEKCGQFRFPIFNTACIMIVECETTGRICLLKQYGRDRYILCAGYVTRGEAAENTVVREVKEELNLDVTHFQFNRTKFFEKSNSLMMNFTAYVENENVSTTDEVDNYKWFTPEEARQNIASGSLAEEFLVKYLDSREK